MFKIRQFEIVFLALIHSQTFSILVFFSQSFSILVFFNIYFTLLNDKKKHTGT